MRENSTVLYAPGMDAMAKDLQMRLGAPEVLCTKDMMLDTKNLGLNELRTAGICWDRFKSDDPNIKLRVETVKDKHIIFIMNMEQNDALFEQLAVLLFLQRFTLPNPEQQYADGKWKATIRDKAYTTCAVASITIVCPWCRYCQVLSPPERRTCTRSRIQHYQQSRIPRSACRGVRKQRRGGLRHHFPPSASHTRWNGHRVGQS